MTKYIIVAIVLLLNSCGHKADWNGVWQCHTCDKHNAIWAEHMCFHCHELVAVR